MNMHSSSYMVRTVFGALRRLSSAASPSATNGAVRDTFKRLDSRKTFLIDTYVQMLRENPITLVVHNSTLLKNEDKALRLDIAKAGGRLTVVRSKLFNVALRGLEHPDPASHQANKLYRRTKHPLSQLITGPSAVITIPEVDPSVVDRVVSVVDKSNNRLILLGGKVDGGVLTQGQVNEFRKLPTIGELRAQLAGVLTILGGAGLTQTLESSTKMLYLTLKSHHQEQEKCE